MEGRLIAYGVYLPRYRLQRAELADALSMPAAGQGARTVSSYDEDAMTMGVEAARRAMSASGRAGVRPDWLALATTTPPYVDKTNASAIHAALDLGHDGCAVDMGGSPRSAVGVLRAAASSSGVSLAVLSDVRIGRPGSEDEREGSDGAAAFLFANSGEAAEVRPIAEVLARASTTAEFLDRWRIPGEPASHVWESRFGLERYLPLIKEAGARALAAADLPQVDRLVVSSPHARVATAASRMFAPRDETPMPVVGYTGAADVGIRLAAVLDVAAAGETILVVSAADGCDTTVLRTTDALPAGRAAVSVADQLSRGHDVRYATFLAWRGFIERESPRRPEPDPPVPPASARSEDWKFAFVGGRCENCGRVQVPPPRVCAECHAVDQMARVRLADHHGTVVTYTVDRLAYSPSPPMIDVVVDFDGGGRYTLELTDATVDEVEIGTRVEMVFRRLYTTGNIHNYFWKATPANGKQRDM